MTPLAGFVAAIIAGWIIRDPRRAAITATVPFLIVMVVQTLGLDAGYGVSPPSTVYPINGTSIGYYVVQAILLAFTLGIAIELAAIRRARMPAGDRAGAGRRTALAAAVLTVLTAMTCAVWALIEAPVAHHSSTGAPPPQGLIGIGLLIVSLAVLSVLTVRDRRAAKRVSPATGASAVMADERN
jgi:hypothetical protein